jgi:hypothetical protein
MVQIPADGRLFNTMLPVAVAHVGCVNVPNVGAEGVGGCVLISTPAEVGEVHPDSFVTMNEYMFGDNPEIVVLVPDPLLTAPPGDLVIVHVPDEGKFLNSMLPVDIVQAG